MNDRTSNTRQNDPLSRYDRTAWLRGQGQTPWLARMKFDGDTARVDLRGIPPIIRQLLRDLFGAIELMDSEQIGRLLAGSLQERATLTHQVLTEPGR